MIKTQRMPRAANRSRGPLVAAARFALAALGPAPRRAAELSFSRFNGASTSAMVRTGVSPAHPCKCIRVAPSRRPDQARPIGHQGSSLSEGFLPSGHRLAQDRISTALPGTPLLLRERRLPLQSGNNEGRQRSPCRGRKKSDVDRLRRLAQAPAGVVGGRASIRDGSRPERVRAFRSVARVARQLRVLRPPASRGLK